MTSLLQRPVSSLLASLRARELSARELLDATLSRIEATHPQINAFVSMRDSERLQAEADAADARIARGEARLLEGIPFGVKELEDLEGLPSTHASLPFKDEIATRSSAQVERLEAAGAIAVGKTNAPEFGYTALTKNLIHGETRNPWDLSRTPGGSSGGSSAAICGGVIPLATASDGGGSVRIPASFTGCFGLKVSYGRIPHGPEDLWVTDDTAVHGPLTRTVLDAALHMDAVVGAHPLDPNSLPHPGYSYVDILENCPEGLRIGFSPDLGYGVVQSDVAAVVEEAARTFEKLGHRLVAIEGGPPEPGFDWGYSGAFELAARLHRLLPEREGDFGRSFIAGVKQASSMPAERWEAFKRRREELNVWCAQTFAQVDLLLTPTVPYDPPAARGPLTPEVEGRKQPAANVGSFTIPFNLSWHPAGTIRAGLSKAGLPVGMQIVAPRHRDDLVLQAARAYERECAPQESWPTL